MDNETDEVIDGVEQSDPARTTETSDGEGQGTSEGSVPEEEDSSKQKTPEGLPEDQEWNEVEFNEQQQRRFNRMYAQVKQGERVMKQLAEDNKKLISKIQDIETRTTEKEISDSETNLKAARRAAMEEGNFDDVDKYETELDKLKEARLEARQKAQDEFKQEEDKDESGLSIEDKQKLDVWAFEENGKGDLRRPYVDEGHPDHALFRHLADAVLTDKRMSGKSIEDYFEKVDKLCMEAGLLEKPKAKKQNPSVLSNLAGEAKQKKQYTLTPEQRKVARMMNLTDAEYYESLNE